jgi:hypothetical protein
MELLFVDRFWCGSDENSKLLQHEAPNPPSTHATPVQIAKYFYVSQNDIVSLMRFNSEFKFLELIELCLESLNLNRRQGLR